MSQFAINPDVSDDEARALVDAATWYHSFELRPGLVTKGTSKMNPAAALNALGVPEDLTGLKALDIGAWDGPLTFELERRGAEAHALDIQDPDRVGFNTAKRIIGSRATHTQASCMDLPLDDLKDFDIVLFRGVFYHLKGPPIAFEAIANSMKTGGMVYFAGEGLINYAQDLEGNRLDIDIRALNDTGVPIALSYPGRYRAGNSWFIPNIHCLRGWVESAGFEVVDIWGTDEAAEGQRLAGSARKVRSAREEHPIY